jgi:3-hydroxyacyl-[acyl-carrier-protein] dehydratase
MSQDVLVSTNDLLRRAAKEHLLPRTAFDQVVLDRAGVENLIPHRDPFLFIDAVTWFDSERQLIASRYELNRASEIFAGHFPSRPIWPGVLQIEAIGQAGLILCLLQANALRQPEPILTHVLGARFLRPIEPGGCVEIAAFVAEEGFFSVVVGQCLQHGNICSVASVKISF